MSESVRIIKWLILLSVFSLILTYAISVNLELGLLCIDSPYISNSFAFSICGGIFASVIVMLACEIRKYIDLKRNVINVMYTQFYFMYGQLRMIYDNINFYLDTPTEIVPSNLLYCSMDNLKRCINNLNNLDYILLCRKDIVSDIIEDFKSNGQQFLNEYLTDCLNFEIALKTDAIVNLENENSSLVTSTSPKTKAVLQILKVSAKPIMDYIDNCLQDIDSQCKYKYGWDNDKNYIDKNIKQQRYIGLDDFIKSKSKILNSKSLI